MPAILLALPTFYPLIREGFGDITALIKYIGSIRSAAQQSGEWTAEHEAQYQAELDGTITDPAYQPDPKN